MEPIEKLPTILQKRLRGEKEHTLKADRAHVILRTMRSLSFEMNFLFSKDATSGESIPSQVITNS